MFELRFFRTQHSNSIQIQVINEIGYQNWTTNAIVFTFTSEIFRFNLYVEAMCVLACVCTHTIRIYCTEYKSLIYFISVTLNIYVWSIINSVVFQWSICLTKCLEWSVSHHWLIVSFDATNYSWKLNAFYKHLPNTSIYRNYFCFKKELYLDFFNNCSISDEIIIYTLWLKKKCTIFRPAYLSNQ